MKNWLGLLSTSIAVVAGFAAPAEGQSLADAARREAERRSKITERVKVYTNADIEGASLQRPVLAAFGGLKPSNTVESVQAARPDAPSPQAAGEPSALPKVREKRDEEHWRERAKVIRDRLDRLRADAAAIEGRIAALRVELQSAPASRVPALENEIRQASPDLARLQVELRLIQDEWTAFEERARQAKIPSSWIHSQIP